MRRETIYFKQDKETIALLRAEKKRTGVSAMALFRGRKDIPQKLTTSAVNGWLLGYIISAYREDVDYILNLYSSLPDNPWVNIDENLQTRINEIGIKYSMKIQGTLKKSPEYRDVKYHCVNTVMRGIRKKCRKRTLDFIFSLEDQEN